MTKEEFDNLESGDLVSCIYYRDGYRPVGIVLGINTRHIDRDEVRVLWSDGEIEYPHHRWLEPWNKEKDEKSIDS